MSETPSPGILPGILEPLIKVFEELREPRQNEIPVVTQNQEEGRQEVLVLQRWELWHGNVALQIPPSPSLGAGSPVRRGQGAGQGAEQQKQPHSNDSN